MLLKKILAIFLSLVVVVIFVSIWSLRTSSGTVTINGTDLSVLVAERAFARHKGLSGYTAERLAPHDGMLFVFPRAEVRTFWMKGMRMDLDVVWIGNGRILAIDRDVPAPLSRSHEPERMTSHPLQVDMVLELPAGGVETFGLVEGMRVTLSE